MNPLIETASTEIASEYWILTKSLGGVVDDLLRMPNPTALSSRAIFERNTRRISQVVSANIGAIVERRIRQVAEDAKERIETIREGAPPQATADAIEELIVDRTRDLEGWIESQVDRDVRSLQAQIRQRLMLRTMGKVTSLQSIDRSGKRWSSANLVSSEIRHALVLVEFDVAYLMLDGLGLTDMSVTHPERDLDLVLLQDYPSYRDSLHPNTRRRPA